MRTAICSIIFLLSCSSTSICRDFPKATSEGIEKAAQGYAEWWVGIAIRSEFTTLDEKEVGELAEGGVRTFTLKTDGLTLHDRITYLIAFIRAYYEAVKEQGAVVAGDEPKFGTYQTLLGAEKYIEDRLPTEKKNEFRCLGGDGFPVLKKIDDDWYWVVKVPFGYSDSQQGRMTESADVRVKDGKIVGFDIDEKSLSRVR